MNPLILLGAVIPFSIAAVMVWDRLSRRGRMHLVFGGMLVATAAAIAFGVWAHWPLLRAEHARLESWQVVLIWTADAAALVWFSVVAAKYCAPERSNEDFSDPPSRPFCSPRLFFLGMLIPLGIDLGMTIYLLNREAAEFRAAAVTVGEVWRVEREENAKNGMLRFHLHCRFADSAGVLHDTRLTVSTDRDVQIGGGLAQRLRDPLRDGPAPFPVRIAYVSQSPHRNWLADYEPSLGWRLHHLSLLLVFAQGFVLLPVTVGLRNEAAGEAGFESRGSGTPTTPPRWSLER